MKDASEPRPFFEQLKAGLEEGIRWARGDLNLRTMAVPESPPELHAADVVRLRRRLCMSQAVFARVLNVSIKTVQSWEQGERNPSQAAQRLLQVLGERPEEVCQVVGLERDAEPLDKTSKRRSKGGTARS